MEVAKYTYNCVGVVVEKYTSSLIFTTGKSSSKEQAETTMQKLFGGHNWICKEVHNNADQG